MKNHDPTYTLAPYVSKTIIKLGARKDTVRYEYIYMSLRKLSRCPFVCAITVYYSATQCVAQLVERSLMLLN